MINFGTKFHIGQKVKIKYGLHKGKTVIVDDFSCLINMGIGKDAIRRGIPEPLGMYTVSTAWWNPNVIYCNEIDLEEIKNA